MKDNSKNKKASKASNAFIPVGIKFEAEPAIDISKILCTLNLKNGNQLQIYDPSALLLILERVV